MAADPLIVRPARPEDGESIFSWTQNTFSWGDYIPRVWQTWLGADNGRLLVAEFHGRIVGNLHVVFLGNHEGWMEGMRVHPEARKQGVATALDYAGQQVARQSGCRLVRLETASTNVAAQSAIITYGYHRLAVHRGWEAAALPGEPSRIRQARLRDASALYDLWNASWMRRAVRGLAPMADGWRWGELTRARLRDYIARGAVWVTPTSDKPRGFAILRRDDEDLDVALTVGRARDVQELLTDLRKLAAREHMETLYLILPVSTRAARWAEAAGFTAHEHSMYIYECPLR